MKVIWTGLGVVAMLLISTRLVFAGVVINEISPAGEPVWIELYNDSAATIDLEGWEVTDETSGSDDLTITIATYPSTSIAAHGYYVVSNPNGDWLRNSGEQVFLYDVTNNQIDTYTYGNTSVGQVWARISDGSSNWQKTTQTTQNSANPSPTPTPIPSPTPTATPQPTPTPTKTPTPTSTPTPKPAESAGKPTATPKPTPTPTVTGHAPTTEQVDQATVSAEVLGEVTQPTASQLGGPTESAGGQAGQVADGKKKIADFIIPLVIAGLGILLIGSAVVIWIRGRKA